MRNNAASTDHSIISDRHAGQNGSISSYKNMVANMYLTNFGVSKGFLRAGIMRHNRHADTHRHIIADRDQKTMRRIKETALLTVEILANHHSTVNQGLGGNLAVQEQKNSF